MCMPQPVVNFDPSILLRKCFSGENPRFFRDAHTDGGTAFIEIQQQRRQMESPHYFMHFENFDFFGAVVISELK